jgi:hypothetical protein
MIKKIPYQSLLAVAISTISISQAQAADFYFGEDSDISVQINSQFSVGASWRMEDRDLNYVGEANGGSIVGSTVTMDDGTLNYDKGDSFSQIFKGSHDIQVTAGNFGAFTRFKYWSDQELENGDVDHGNSPNGYATGKPLSDASFSDNAKFEGISLLDAYVYGSFDVADMPLDVRLGRQVVSWGESTFIQGGLNSSNPFDVSALRRPGASLKEGILPVGMAYANLGVTENLSIEAFYQYEWEKTEIDGCGTLFAADFVADGCNFVAVIADKQALPAGYAAERKADVEAKDDGQFGLAARFYSEELNNTEFGFYYMNIHSRVPLINVTRNSIPGTVIGTAAGSPFVPSSHPTLGALSALNPAYLIEFPEDLEFFGLSFASNVAGVALSGEVSYKPDTPVQINGNHLLAGALAEAPIPFGQRLIASEPGAVVQGWDPLDVTQVQVTAIKFIEQVLGASRLTLIGEVGATFVDGAEDSDMLYGRNTTFGLDATPNGDQGGFTTDSAWGYRARASLEYSNVFAGISLKPTLDFTHDVEGYAPSPAAQFNEGSQSIGLNVEASYMQTYTATLAYKAFNGGDFNTNTDKDFVSISLGLTY